MLFAKITEACDAAGAILAWGIDMTKRLAWNPTKNNFFNNKPVFSVLAKRGDTKRIC